MIRLRYGINGDEPTPLRETSRRLELKQSEVKKLEERGLSRLAQAREVEAMSEAGLTRHGLHDQEPQAGR